MKFEMTLEHSLMPLWHAKMGVRFSGPPTARLKREWSYCGLSGQVSYCMGDYMKLEMTLEHLGMV